jgi:hypothetical protein
MQWGFVARSRSHDPGRAVEGLEVYHHAYRARLIECLVDDCPALHYALGAEAFAELAGRYIARHLSRSPNLNAFGSHMENFCRTEEDVRAGFRADLARLEWALVEILHAEDAAPLAAQQLTRAPTAAWADAWLLASHTLRVCRFDYPVNAFFRAFKDDEAPTVPAAAPVALAVYRQGFTLWRMVLTPAMADLLEDLVRGATLGDAVPWRRVSRSPTLSRRRPATSWRGFRYGSKVRSFEGSRSRIGLRDREPVTSGSSAARPAPGPRPRERGQRASAATQRCPEGPPFRRRNDDLRGSDRARREQRLRRRRAASRSSMRLASSQERAGSCSTHTPCRTT